MAYSCPRCGMSGSSRQVCARCGAYLGELDFSPGPAAPQEMLKKYWGHDAFRPGQKALIDALLAKRDAFGVMPTGAGKSVCYQLPALMLNGTAIVISPLISLMKDQVGALRQMGVRAAFLNSALSAAQYQKALQNAHSGAYRILYVAPERLFTSDFQALCRQIPISLIAVDEAHCVSQWGQDFRPSYLQIAQFIQTLPHRPPVAAFTATATQQVRQDIVRLLALRDPVCAQTGFDRPNLYFEVQTPKSKKEALLALIRRYNGQSGIVYCATRRGVDQVHALLCQNGVPAARYHAGMEDLQRKENQEAFVLDQLPVMVATNAFGMGIDKSNVSFVIHYNMPKNIESYYQEAGRAGRDGADAQCVLLYSRGDVQINRMLLENAPPNEQMDAQTQQQVRAMDYERLNQMQQYCNASDCLRARLLRYFGQESAPRCQNCSNCKKEFQQIDITVQAQKILSCVARTGQRFGKTVVADVLAGNKNPKMAQLGLTDQTTYGILFPMKKREICEMIEYLMFEGYLEAPDGKYPVLKLTQSAVSVLRGQRRVMQSVPKTAQEKADIGAYRYAEPNEALYQRLRALRLEIAQRQHVPAYMIFTDSTLRDMSRKMPQTPEAFLTVSGVGAVKMQRYGAEFLQVCCDFTHEKGT